MSGFITWLMVRGMMCAMLVPPWVWYALLSASVIAAGVNYYELCRYSGATKMTWTVALAATALALWSLWVIFVSNLNWG